MLTKKQQRAILLIINMKAPKGEVKVEQIGDNRLHFVGPKLAPTDMGWVGYALSIIKNFKEKSEFAYEVTSSDPNYSNLTVLKILF